MDIEAYAVIVDLLAQAHAYGDSIASKAELWIGISSGLIVMAYFAPDRLKVSITTLVIFLYIALSVFLFSNMVDDLAMSRLAIEDAKAIAEENAINSRLLAYRLEAEGGGSGETTFGFVAFLGLFLGTIGFLVLTALQTWRKDRKRPEIE